MPPWRDHAERGRRPLAGGTGYSFVCCKAGRSGPTAGRARNVDAVMYHHLTYEEALQKQLAVMDLAAFCQCRDYNMPLRVFNINKPGALLRVVCGKDEGTTVSKN